MGLSAIASDLELDFLLPDDKEILVHGAGEIDAYTASKLREELLPLAEGEINRLSSI